MHVEDEHLLHRRRDGAFDDGGIIDSGGLCFDLEASVACTEIFTSDVPAPAQSQKPGQAGPKKAGPSRAMVAGLSRLLARPTICAGQSRWPAPRLSRDLVYPTNGERRGHRPLSYPPPQFTGTPTRQGPLYAL